MKQYVISYAYIGNIEVSMYENGVLINSVVVADYDISGYVSCLQSQGYVEAFDVQKALEELDAARDAYTVAIEAWEKPRPLPWFGERGESVGVFAY